jgi:hypothetical protein
MLKKSSVEQMIDLLTHVKRKCNAGYSIRKAYQEAVLTISKNYNVAYQTIGDLCCRRLKLSEINIFINKLEDWIHGNPDKLKQLLLQNSETSCRQQIVQFFDNEILGVTTKPQVDGNIPIEEHEIFTVQLHKDYAKKLKVLTVMNELSIHKKLTDYLENKIEEEYTSWLKTQVSN